MQKSGYYYLLEKQQAGKTACGACPTREGHTRRGTRLGGGGRLGQPCQLGLRVRTGSMSGQRGRGEGSRPRRTAAHAAGGASPGTRAGKRPGRLAPPATKASGKAEGQARWGWVGSALQQPGCQVKRQLPPGCAATSDIKVQGWFVFRKSRKALGEQQENMGGGAATTAAQQQAQP